jgi:hypothetical protein
MLRLPDRTCRRLVERFFMSADKLGRHVGLDRLQAHPVLGGIIERERDKIDLDDPGKTAGKIAKQLVQVAMRRDGFCHLEQGLVTLGNRLAG